MSDLSTLEAKARAYAAARERMSDAVAALRAAQTELERNHMPGIRRAINKASEHEAALRDLVAQHPELFDKPRTRVVEGIKFGFQKGRGKLVIDDEERTLKLIAHRLDDRADMLVEYVPRLVKSAIAKLTVAELRSIGCTVSDTGDEVVVQATDTAVDKLVTALLKSALDEATAET